MGGDIMEFPDTVEEFMEEYKMVDKHEIYSNGTEYVPIFRMEQWFEHCRATEKITQHQWIPCSERLPEYKQKIFFTEKNNETGELYVGRGMFCGVTERTCSRSNPWYYADTFSVSERRWHVLDSKIVAWFPVPEPWKGGR